MNFIFTLTAAIFSFTIGIAFGSFLLMMLEAFTHRPQKTYRLSLSLFMISIAVAVVAVAIIVIARKSDGSIQAFIHFLPKKTVDIIYYSTIFVVGILCGSFPIIFFPITIFLYVALSVFTTATVYKNFGLQSDNVSVTVLENKIEIDKQAYELKSLPKQKNEIIFVVYTLPDKLLVPLPRAWYIHSGVANTDELATEQNQIISSFNELNPATCTFTSLPHSKEMNDSMLFFYYRYIFSIREMEKVELPTSNFYPAIYSIKSVRGLGQINFIPYRSF